MHGLIQSKRKYKPRHRLFQDGQCLAVLRAFTGARFKLQNPDVTLAQTAAMHGSNVHYIELAIVLLKSDNQTLIHHALRGNVSLFDAAARVEQLVKSVEAYRKLSPENLAAFRVATGATADLGDHILYSTAEEKAAASRKVGVDVIWDTMVDPIITTAEPTITPAL